MRKILFIFSTLSLLFVSCDKVSSSKVTIKTIQFVKHTDLSQSVEGFLKGLKDYSISNVNIDSVNCFGSESRCAYYASRAMEEGCQMIVTFGTQASTITSSIVHDIPIIAVAVTDPVGCGIIENLEQPDKNITGISDLIPYSAQVDLIKSLVPQARNVGLLYSAEEQDSLFQITLIKMTCRRYGYNCIDYPCYTSREMEKILSNLDSSIDVLYVPQDMLISLEMPQIMKYTLEKKIPVIAGEKGMVRDGALATYGIDYFELGEEAGKMAIRVLRNGGNVSSIPFSYIENYDLSINYDTVRLLGIKVPEELRNY